VSGAATEGEVHVLRKDRFSRRGPAKGRGGALGSSKREDAEYKHENLSCAEVS
jgi:hypothetical protein